MKITIALTVAESNPGVLLCNTVFCFCSRVVAGANKMSQMTMSLASNLDHNISDHRAITCGGGVGGMGRCRVQSQVTKENLWSSDKEIVSCNSCKLIPQGS